MVFHITGAIFFVCVFFLLKLSVVNSINNCPSRCKCSLNRKDPSKYRINCSKISNDSIVLENSGYDGVSVKNVLDLSELPELSFFLILQGNFITTVRRDDMIPAFMLQKLDLSKNSIKVIEDDAFKMMKILKKLDLSKNKISNLESSMLNGLINLLRFDLSSNLLFYMKNDTLKPLSKLKHIVLDRNPLICDCYLKWLPSWLNTHTIQISEKSFCKYPSSLRKTSLKSINASVLKCGETLEVPIFELNPSQHQLVFEGDEITLTCTVSNLPDITLDWSVVDEIGEETFLTINNTVVEKFDYYGEINIDDNLRISQLSIHELDYTHDGLWNCHVTSPFGKVKNSVRLSVVTLNATYCPEVITDGRKGTYSWPETIAPNKLSLKCQDYQIGMVVESSPHVHFECSVDGSWNNLDTSECTYVSGITKILQQFAETDLKASDLKAISLPMRSRSLLNYTSQNLPLFTEIDVDYLVSTVMNYFLLNSTSDEIDSILLDVIDLVLNVDLEILSSSQKEFRTFSRLRKFIGFIPETASIPQGFSYFGDNLAIERNQVSYEVVELSCTSISIYSNLTETKRSIVCNFFNLSSSMQYIHQEYVDIQGALHLPVAFFKLYAESNRWTKLSHFYQFTIFSNSQCFPFVNDENFNVTSAVISIKFANVSFPKMLLQPVHVMLRSKTADSDIPAWWNSEAYDGLGNWSTEDCEVIKREKEHVFFSCFQLSHYALLRNSSAIMDGNVVEVPLVILLFPAVHIGSFLCVICLMVTIFLYLAYNSEIKMPAKAKHSLVNVWFCTLMLCILFNVGMKLIKLIKICQAVGLLVNFLSLSILLWILITICNVYSKLRKPIIEEDYDSEDEMQEITPKKPMLRFYLIGFGIPAIVCGISAAIHLHMYASTKYCFLPLYQSLGPLYCPASIFSALILFVYIRVLCMLSGNESDDDLLKLNDESIEDISVVRDIEDDTIIDENRKTLNNNDEEEEEEVDEEHSYRSQITLQLFYLILFLCSWTSAAAYIENPKINFFKPYGNIIYGAAYCFFITTLGIYVLVAYCFCRKDIRKCICKMLQIKVNNSMSLQQQSDVTITTNVTQTEPSMCQEDQLKCVDKSSSPPPLEELNLNYSVSSSTHDSLLNNSFLAKAESATLKSDKVFIPEKMNFRDLSNSHAGYLNRDSSKSITSVAMTEKPKGSYMMKQMNGLRTQSPSTGNGFIHPMENWASQDVYFYDPKQQIAARRFFQRQREKRRRLTSKNDAVNDSSSRVEDTLLDTSIDTSLSLPKQSNDKVPSDVNKNLVDQSIEINMANEFLPLNENISTKDLDIIEQASENNKRTKEEIQNSSNHLPSKNDNTNFNGSIRTCVSPSSVVSLSRRSFMSENLGKKRHKRHHRRTNSKNRGSKQSIVSNNSNSYPFRGRNENDKDSSKISRSKSAYEQINNNNYNSTSSEDESRSKQKPRSKQRKRYKDSLKKETSV